MYAKEEGSVLLGNNKPCNIARIGTIQFKFHDGVERILQEVRYVPKLERNLISLGELDKKGYTFKGENGILKVIKGSMVVIRGCKKNGLYSVEGSVVTSSVASVSNKVQSKSELWHKRLGHVSERGLIELGKQGLLGTERVEKLSICEYCMLGKACRVKFNVGQQRTKGTLD